MPAPRTAILVTGARGQVGCELARVLAAHGDVTALDRSALDLADPDRIVAVLRELKPGLIVNAGAYTAVDRAESERDAAYAVNSTAPGILAEEAKRQGAVLIHYSTDYVYDGESPSPYTEDMPTHPLNVYGASKRDGERAIAQSGAKALVFRTSWVYGARGSNFLLTILRLARDRDELRIVADQHGTPNWCRTIATATAALVARGLPWLAARAGLYHMTSAGATTWHGFAQAIVGTAPRPRIVPIATCDYPTPARRPANGVLSSARFEATFEYRMPEWRSELAACRSAMRADASAVG
jgi:dTDP-4-dehydrorhamnose reductase